VLFVGPPWSDHTILGHADRTGRAGAPRRRPSLRPARRAPTPACVTGRLALHSRP
jgi:hypothetical protein